MAAAILSYSLLFFLVILRHQLFCVLESCTSGFSEGIQYFKGLYIIDILQPSVGVLVKLEGT